MNEKRIAEMTDSERLEFHKKLQAEIRQWNAEKKEKAKQRKRATRLLKRKRRLERQLEETTKEFNAILYNDKVFEYYDRRHFMNKHKLV